MQKYKNLTIIGTSHIAIESVKEVTREILAQEPQVVALELDKVRIESLLSDKKRSMKLSDIRQLGIKGFLFNLIGAYVEKKLGDSVNVKPGAEMKAAFDAARKIKAEIALVDQDVRITMKRLSSELTWREKFRFVGDIFKSFFKPQKLKIDLTRVPDKKMIDKLTTQLRKRYPSLYKVLISERNEVLAKNLYTLMQKKDSVLAVVGAGHEDDIILLIKKKELWTGAKTK